MVYVLLAPGFEESEAIVPTDLLRQGGLETALVSLSGPTVTGDTTLPSRPTWSCPRWIWTRRR